MKAVIMCAGKGTRMLPLTEKVPKVLIPINGKPFLYYLMKNLQDAGFNEFGLIVGYLKEQIIDFCKEYGFFASIIEQTKLLGTGDAIKCAKEFTENKPFIVCGGDNLWSAEEFSRVNNNDKFTYVVGLEVKNPSRYGVLQCEGDFLKKIVEKPKKYVGNLINTGLYKFTPQIYEELEKVPRQENGEYYLTDAVTYLAKQKKVKVLKIKDYWKDLGKPEDIKPMEEFLTKDY